MNTNIAIVDKRKLLLEQRLGRLKKKDAGASTMPPLLRDRRDGDIHPLSDAQEGLWFLEQLGGVEGAYNVSVGVRLEGELDVGALGRALDEIVRRHEALRTRFEVRGGEPVQVVDPAYGFDLSAQEVPEAELAEVVGSVMSAGFDLGSERLMRVRLLRLEERSHVLVVVVHHIVTDGWSMGILLRELVALYGAYRRGEGSPLAELEVQYGDYARWHRGWLESGVLASQLDWWRERLAGAPEALDLPTDRLRPAVESHRGAVVGFDLDADLVRKLVELGQREGATLFMVLLAGFELVLARWSGQDDVVVGTPVANRMRAELEPLVGFFVNTLVLRGICRGIRRVSSWWRGRGRWRWRRMRTRRRRSTSW